MSLTIEKLIYGGDGLARLPADARGSGKAVFVPFTLPGEEVEAKIIEEKPGFARAVLADVIRPSADRISPHCRYFAECGGCHYQHTTYEQQLTLKAGILKENLKRIAKLELAADLRIHASPPWEYRNRARFQVRTSPHFTVGYYRVASHDVVPVEECPINSPLVNRALLEFRGFGAAVPPPAGLREIEFFADAEDANVMVGLSCSAGSDARELGRWSEQLKQAIEHVLGISAFPQRVPANHKGDEDDHASKPFFTLGSQELRYRTANFTYRVGAGAFFQVNRHMVDRLIDLVSKDRSGNAAVDLYAGVGLFTVPLARSFRHIRAVEASPISHTDLLYNAPENVKSVRATTESFLEQASRKPAPDLVVVDPPRSGLRHNASRLLAQWQPRRITYVSCDPATLARDLVPLLAAGYKVDEVHLVDLFPQTYHIESVIQLVR